MVHPPTTLGSSSQAPPPQAYGIQGPSPYFAGGDHGRGGPYYGGNAAYQPGNFPPPYPHNGLWDHNFPGPGYPPAAGHPAGSLRRDDGGSNRRLSDRISGFATEIPPGAGLPPKPMSAALDTALVSGNTPARRNNRNSVNQVTGPPPPPPPDAKEDPRAAAGKRVSYHDMDLVAEVCPLFIEWKLADNMTGRC